MRNAITYVFGYEHRKEKEMAIRILFAVEENDERNLRFVEVENEVGESVSVGTWSEDEDGYRVLEIESHEV